jgi:hypothetical protein
VDAKPGHFGAELALDDAKSVPGVAQLEHAAAEPDKAAARLEHQLAVAGYEVVVADPSLVALDCLVTTFPVAALERDAPPFRACIVPLRGDMRAVDPGQNACLSSSSTSAASGLLAEVQGLVVRGADDLHQIGSRRGHLTEVPNPDEVQDQKLDSATAETGFVGFEEWILWTACQGHQVARLHVGWPPTADR